MTVQKIHDSPLMASARTKAGRQRGSTDNWSTPHTLYDWIARTFQVTIDPCCGDDSVNSGKVRGCTIVQNGLEAPWDVNTVYKQVAYVNPPYSQLRAWVEKALHELGHGSLDEAVFLIPARTDTRAFRLLATGAYRIWFFPKRITFVHADGTVRDPAPFPSALIWLKRMPWKTPLVSFKDPRNDSPTVEDLRI